MRKRMMTALGAVLVLGASRADAQVFTPPYQSPVSGQDIGVYLFDAEGGDLGVEGVLRRGFGGGDLGLRLGFADGPEDGVLLLGVDYRNPMRLADVQPLALAFTLGAQAALLDGDAFGLQGGISIGYTFPEVRLTPYIHPRLALVNANEETDLEVEADIGFDLGLTNSLNLRLDGNLGDGADWGIGLAFRR